MKEYLNIVTYYCIGSLVIMVVMMMFTYCYIGSLRNRNFEYDYKFLDESGNQLTVEEKKALDQEKVNEKYDLKRKELEQKYPKYREYR